MDGRMDRFYILTMNEENFVRYGSWGREYNLYIIDIEWRRFFVVVAVEDEMSNKKSILINPPRIYQD